VSGRGRKKSRSGCPLSASLEVFGDRWSLLIVRDLMVRGFRTFGEFQSSGEGIATNILSDRLKRLDAAGIIGREAEESDGRRVNYRLTQKGIDLAPVLLEIFVWSAKYERTGASREIITEMERHRDRVVAEARRRWEQRDLTPLIPKVEGEALRISKAKSRRDKQ
jgi:DNA-binding HxlR family transcriptional regulator